MTAPAEPNRPQTSRGASVRDALAGVDLLPPPTNLERVANSTGGVLAYRQGLTPKELRRRSLQLIHEATPNAIRTLIELSSDAKDERVKAACARTLAEFGIGRPGEMKPDEADGVGRGVVDMTLATQEERARLNVLLSEVAAITATIRARASDV